MGLSPAQLHSLSARGEAREIADLGEHYRGGGEADAGDRAELPGAFVAGEGRLQLFIERVHLRRELVDEPQRRIDRPRSTAGAQRSPGTPSSGARRRWWCNPGGRATGGRHAGGTVTAKRQCACRQGRERCCLLASSRRYGGAASGRRRDTRILDEPALICARLNLSLDRHTDWLANLEFACASVPVAHFVPGSLGQPSQSRLRDREEWLRTIAYPSAPNRADSGPVRGCRAFREPPPIIFRAHNRHSSLRVGIP